MEPEKFLTHTEFNALLETAKADRWVKIDIRIPEHGGHVHDFFCDCGTQLALPPDMQPRPQYVCPACGKTYSGERFDAAVRCFHHHQLANAALNLAASALLANDTDPNGYALSVTGVSNPVNGTVSFDSQTNTISFTNQAMIRQNPARARRMKLEKW